jgi:hypothetical protein
VDRQGRARDGRHGVERRGMARTGAGRQAWQGEGRRGRARDGRRGEAWDGEDRRGTAGVAPGGRNTNIPEVRHDVSMEGKRQSQGRVSPNGG